MRSFNEAEILLTENRAFMDFYFAIENLSIKPIAGLDSFCFNIIMEKPNFYITNEMPVSFERIRQLILEQIKSKEEGLDTNRIHNFLQSYGINIDPQEKVLYLEDGDLSAIEEIFRQTGFNANFSPKSIGCLIEDLNIILITRSDLEKTNGPILTEATSVHEQCHGSNGYRDYRIKESGKWLWKKQEAHKIRQGQSLYDPVSGGFIEEGFAEMLEARYMEAYAGSEYFNKIKKVLEIPEDAPLDIPVASRNGILYKPIRYLIFQTDGSITPFSRGAGYSLDLLCNKDELLFPSLIEARYSVDGLRKVARIIDGIKPGLYKKLRSLNSQDTFDILQEI